MNKRHRVKAMRRLIPAIPPDNYSGKISDWMVVLQELGLWSEGWCGEVLIPVGFYVLLLESRES